MRKHFFLAMLLLTAAATATAQTIMKVSKTDKSTIEIPVEEVDSINFIEIPNRAIDLGLSVLWSSVNIGAEMPEDYGWYLAYGEMAEKPHYSNGFYSLKDSEGTLLPNYVISGTELDAATVLWGEGWHMPTLDEAKELMEKCTWQWEKLNNVNGMRVTGPNGNSIFLPAAGECSCTHGPNNDPSALANCNGYTPSNPLSAGVRGDYRLGELAKWENGNWGIDNNRILSIVGSAPNSGTINSTYRCTGHPIRPVKTK